MKQFGLSRKLMIALAVISFSAAMVAADTCDARGKANAAHFGGDPNRIFLIGHSAGATHVAGYVFDKSLQPSDGPGIAGAVLISGRYRVDYDPADPNGHNMQAYFGDDPSQYSSRSPITHIRDVAAARLANARTLRDGDGRYDVLEIETRGFKGPRTYDGTGIPLHSDNQSVIKERLYLDAKDPNIAHDEITTFDHALTRPWTVVKNYFRNPDPRPNWTEEDCGENNHVLIGHEDYMLSADGLLMPQHKGPAIFQTNAEVMS